ncbi:flavodoxin domain-containing protein [Nesterenkonia marinintestina]|uniref:flavodoxin domain-containing protein n=1 Tax=Nesterenkonia marinintestina TaxID=2979865 RepID=UPI0021C0EE93|nr:flavodoxin domain-containing protein [Nesterenkonia sp. GX14115]
MTTMVVVASTHGSTTEIGERIAATLSSRGVRAHTKDVSEAGRWLHDASNVVIGMPVYKQKLLADGPMFLESHRTELQGKPLFAFAVGGAPRLDGELASQLRRYGPREIAYFRGAIDSEKLGFVEKLMLRISKSPLDADWRDWPAVEDWARELVSYGVS